MTTLRTLLLAGGIGTVLGLGTSACAAQEVATTPPLEIGAVAPDFAIPGATRYGQLAEHVRLSDYRGQTVVLAFFFRARTRG
jgi:thioredoxin-dependent peroxiredoxin